MVAQARLLSRISKDSSVGRVEWLAVRPERRAQMQVCDRVFALVDKGLEGDHKAQKANGSARQITIVMREHISVVEQLLARRIDPALLRRNIVVSGINLNVLRHQQVKIGESIIEIGAHCHPCSRMREVFGEGAEAALLGHAGYCAKIIQGGIISKGDMLAPISEDMFN